MLTIPTRDNNGALTWIDLGRAKPADSVHIFDMDNTDVDTFNFHPVENATDRAFARAFGLPSEILVDARWGKSGYTVDCVYSPLVAALIMDKQGVKFPYRPDQVVNGLIKPYLQMIVERELECKAFAGQADAFATIRAEFPNSFVCIETDSPTIMSAFRLRDTGLLPHVQGLVGLRPECPNEVRDGRFGLAAQFIDNWIAEQWNNTVQVDHLQLLVGVPDHMAKPNLLGAKMILGQAKARRNTLIVDYDDSPGKGGLVAQGLRKRYPNTRYVQARIGSVGPDVPGLQIDGVAKSASDYVRLCHKFEKQAKKAA